MTDRSSVEWSHSSPPYGFDYDSDKGRLVVDPERFEIVAETVALVELEDESWYAAAKETGMNYTTAEYASNDPERVEAYLYCNGPNEEVQRALDEYLIGVCEGSVEYHHPEFTRWREHHGLKTATGTGVSR